VIYTNLIARRVAPGVPVWNLIARETEIGILSNLPREKAACITARYQGQRLDFRASSTKAVLAALRCAIDALDYIAAEEAAHEDIEDEDGEIARIRHEENLNDAWAQRHAHEDPWY
jgi:hypothetical protein